MYTRQSLIDLFEKKNSILIVLASSVIVLLFLEIMIFVAASSMSGERSMVEVKDKLGNVIHRTSGNSVDQIDQWYFGKKFGNLDNYNVEIKTENKPFPVRAWICASIGVPIVLILLISYLIKVYMALLHSDATRHGESHPVVYDESQRSLSWTTILSSHSIFYLGTIVSILSLVFWMVPNFLADILKSSVSMMQENKWFIIGPVSILVIFPIWIVYLRYKLSKRMMDHQFSLEKYRLDRGIQVQRQVPAHMEVTEDNLVSSGQ